MLYKFFRDGLPEYLVRYYWWAYLWRVSVWFFDHQPIINAILFGQYKRLMKQTLFILSDAPQTSVLQLTCVYGKLTPNILKIILPCNLHITDVAQIQLRLAIRKSGLHSGKGKKPQNKLIPTRMNAEYLGYQSNSFSTVIIFFLLHEMPVEARLRTLSETLRILAPGGRLIITEYGHKPYKHFLYRFPVTRYLLRKYEPFLDTFWSEDITKTLQGVAREHSKSVKLLTTVNIFSKFYRVLEFGIDSST